MRYLSKKQIAKEFLFITGCNSIQTHESLGNNIFNFLYDVNNRNFDYQLTIENKKGIYTISLFAYSNITSANKFHPQCVEMLRLYNIENKKNILFRTENVTTQI